MRLMARIVAAVLLIAIALALSPTMAEEPRAGWPTISVEPEGCGEVSLEVLEERAGSVYMLAEAKSALHCRFVEWRSNVPDYNGSISNPLRFWLRPNMTLTATFLQLGEPPQNASGYAFVIVKANISGFTPHVRLAPRGFETYVSVPEEIYVTESERWVFAGWGGDVESIVSPKNAPAIAVKVDKDVTLVANYVLYMRFLDLWYPASEFAQVEAPVKELGYGLRAVPKEVRLKGLNETLPISAKIPRDLMRYAEVLYQEEVLIGVVARVDEPVKVSINNVIGLAFSDRPMEYWAPRGSTITVVALENEVGAYWLSEDSQVLIVTADAPKIVELRYEVKPHAWMSGLIIYQPVNSLASMARGTRIWPIIEVILEDPLRFSIASGGAIACLGAAIYGLAKGAMGLKAHAQRSRGLRRAATSPFRAFQSFKMGDVLQPAPERPASAAAQSPIVSILLELVRESGAAGGGAQAGYAGKTALADEELVKLEGILAGGSGEVDVNALTRRRWSPRDYEALRRAVEEGRLSLRGSVKPYHDVISRVCDYLSAGPGAIMCLYGDAKAASYIAKEASSNMSRLPVFLNRLETGDVGRAIEEVAAQVPETGQALLIATSEVPDKAVKALMVVAAALEVPAIKISDYPIRGLACVHVAQLDQDDLLAIAVAKAAESRAVKQLNYEVLEMLSRCAYALRGIQTVERFFSIAGPEHGMGRLRALIEEELKTLFTEEELSALQLAIESGRPLLDSVKIYRDILIQMEPRGNIRAMVSEFSKKIKGLLLLEREVESIRGR